SGMLNICLGLAISPCSQPGQYRQQASEQARASPAAICPGHRAKCRSRGAANKVTGHVHCIQTRSRLRQQSKYGGLIIDVDALKRQIDNEHASEKPPKIIMAQP